MNRPLNINAGDNVLAGYDLYLVGGHPAAQQKSPLVDQGSAATAGRSPSTACAGAAVRNVFFSALGVETKPGAGNPAGPSLPSTDTTDPLNVRFHCDIEEGEAQYFANDRLCQMARGAA